MFCSHGTASFVISIIAAVLAGGAVWYARGQKVAAAGSAREAKRSADAAEDALGYQRDEVERNRVLFQLDPMSDDVHLLRNVGTDTAYSVHIDAGDLGFDDNVTDYETLEPDQTAELLLASTLGTMSTHITVSWHQKRDLSDHKRTVRLYVGR